MIDPIDSLAFSMHANKGVYAVLLGSGVYLANCYRAAIGVWKSVLRKNPRYTNQIDRRLQTSSESGMMIACSC